MKNFLTLLVSIFLLTTMPAWAEEAAEEAATEAAATEEVSEEATEEAAEEVEAPEVKASVVKAAVATGIEDREPTGEATSFTDDVDTLWCYSKIKDGEGTTITHNWYRGDELVAEIPLKIRSPLYRTRSSKKIISGWTGAWRVEIIAEDGNVLETLDFTIEAAPEAEAEEAPEDETPEAEEPEPEEEGSGSDS